MSPSEAPGRLALPQTPKSTGSTVLWYLLWRVVGAILIVLLVLTLVFVAAEVLPGNPTYPLPRGGSCVLPPGSTTCVDLRQQLIQHWGLDKPLFDRYVIFLSNFLTGNLGVSVNYRVNVPVWSIIAPVVPITLALNGVVLLLLALLSLPLGLRMGRRKGGFLDLSATLWLSFPVAFSAAFLGFLGFYYFGLVLKAVPLSPVRASDGTTPLANLVWYLVLPSLVFVGGSLGLFAWLVRDHPLRPAAELTPPAPGNWRDANEPFRRRVVNAIPRFLGAVPALFPWVIGAEFLGEALFNVNGLGLLLWTAVIRFDFFLATAVVVVTALLIVLPILLVTDVLHHVWTRRWQRSDDVRAEELRISLREPWQGFRRMLLEGIGPAGIALMLFVVLFIVVGPLFVGPYPTPLGFARPFLPPSADHPLGTDEAGRDILTLLAYGGREVLGVGVLAFAGALLAGLYVAGLTGFLGERATPWLAIPIDSLLVLSVPFALLLGLLRIPDAALWGSTLVVAPIAARILMLEISGTVRSATVRDGTRFSLRARGTRALNLVWGTALLLVGNAFLATSLSVLVWGAFGFIGLGPNGPGSFESWGQMVNLAFNNLAILRGQWWYFAPPIYWIFLAALGPLLLGIGIKGIARTAKGVPAASPGPTVITSLPAAPVVPRD